MAKQSRALIFIFNGYEPSTELIEVLGRELGTRCDVIDHVDNFLLDAKDIANAVMRCATKPVVKQEQHEYTAEENAIIFIGSTMREALGSSYKPERFVSALMERIHQARIHPDEGLNKQFMNAMFILSQDNLVVSKALLRKYYMSEAKIALIKNVYNIMKTF